MRRDLEWTPPHLLAVPIDADLYLDVALFLRESRDGRVPAQAIADAVRQWLFASRSSACAGEEVPGYQWKDVFLPEHTMLRVRDSQRQACAEVIGNQIIYRGQPITPGALAALSQHNVRNAWRQLWLRWPGETQWLPAVYVRTHSRMRRKLIHTAPPPRRIEKWRSDEWGRWGR